jgi:hypothetical protein
MNQFQNLRFRAGHIAKHYKRANARKWQRMNVRKMSTFERGIGRIGHPKRKPVKTCHLGRGLDVVLICEKLVVI